MEILGPSACSGEGKWVLGFPGSPKCYWPLKVILLAAMALLPPCTLARDRGFSVSHCLNRHSFIGSVQHKLVIIHGNQQPLKLGMDGCPGSRDLGMVQDQKTENLEGSWKNPPVFVHRHSSAISGFVNEYFSPASLY